MALPRVPIPRIPVALAVGGIGFVAYVAIAVRLADPLLREPWPVQALFFTVAGLLWVFPAAWLMLWAAGRR